MKKRFFTHALIKLFLAAFVIINVQPLTASAQGTAFTYQGRLNDGANPANGIYDWRFAIYDTNSAGSLIAGPRTNSAINVSNGLFTTILDFGAGAFTGADRWLDIAVRTNGAGTFTSLSSRQKITPAPYAILAGNAATLGGQGSSAFVAKAGDTMSGTLSLPAASITGAGALGTTFQEQIQSSGHTLALGANATAAEVQSQGAVPLYINHGGNDVIMVDSGLGNVGIGTTAPTFPLSLGTGTGNKIALYDGGGDKYGFGVQAGLLQVFTGASSEDIAFGTGSSTNFTETARITGNGKMRVNTMDVAGWIAAGSEIYAQAFVVTSDRNAKENFQPLDCLAVLSKVATLPMSEWNYKTDPATQKHLGPMAQDFQAAFGLNGGDDKHISVADEGGVALAAVQGLNEKVEGEKQQAEIRIQKLEAENAELKARLERLEKLLAKSSGDNR
jgi:hypothetical protein